MTNKAILEQSFIALFDGNKTVEDVAKFFTTDYTQWVDNKELDYDGFLQHAKVLKDVVKSAHVEFLEFMEEGDLTSDIHDVFVTKKNGDQLHVRVIAFYTFKGNQISSVRELTHLISGSEKDHDLGSRT